MTKVCLLIAVTIFSCHAKHVMVVFIHGTLYQSIRHEKLYTYSCDLVYDLGLHPVDLRGDGSTGMCAVPHAAWYIIKSFDVCRSFRYEQQSSSSVSYHYYTFGWSGQLDKAARKEASQSLYAQLNNEYERLLALDKDSRIVIELYGHSHGNQLIFHLAEMRDEHPEHTWTIDRAVLSAAPLHYAMARHVTHLLFKEIINLYSEGDMVQTLDCISVPRGGCYRAFYQLPELRDYLTCCDKSIMDIRIGVYNNYSFFGHGTFFALDRYTPHPTISRSLRQNYRKLISQIHPLPLAAFYPLIIPEGVGLGYVRLSANILHYDGQLSITVYNNVVPETVDHVMFPVDFFEIRDRVRCDYQKQGYVSELAKLYWACIYTIRNTVNKYRRRFTQRASQQKVQAAGQ